MRISISRFVALLATAWLLGSLPGRAQGQTGPITPAPGPETEIKKIPAHPTPLPPPIPTEEIIRQFTANEDAIRQAFQHYTYRQTVRVQELAEDGRTVGEFQLTAEILVRPDGARYERIVSQTPSSLKSVSFSVEDMKVLANLPLFPLTTDQLGKYDLHYEGRELLDQLDTYIFRVTPKPMQFGQIYFSGVVWVDDRDLAIVKSYGKFETAIPPQGRRLPFSLFETYRENIVGKYWFPTYMRSDDYVQVGPAQVPIRLIIRSTDFQLVPAAGTTSEPATAKPDPPKSPQN